MSPSHLRSSNRDRYLSFWGWSSKHPMASWISLKYLSLYWREFSRMYLRASNFYFDFISSMNYCRKRLNSSEESNFCSFDLFSRHHDIAFLILFSFRSTIISLYYFINWISGWKSCWIKLKLLNSIFLGCELYVLFLIFCRIYFQSLKLGFLNWLMITSSYGESLRHLNVYS